jgi:hypothetical protein
MSRNVVIGRAAIAAVMLLAFASVPGSTEEQREKGPGAHGPARAPGVHTDFRRFQGDPRRWDPQHFAAWRGGVWRHDWHNGRYGWWWWVDGGWYFYPAPVYPYPDAVSADVAFDEGPIAPIGPSFPGQVGPPPPPPPTPQVWWYCDSPAGYYPYVTACSTGYRPVPATPR